MEKETLLTTKDNGNGVPTWRWNNWQGTRDFAGRYVFASRYVWRKSVLEIGCGAAWGTNLLGRAGAKSLVGGDVDVSTLRYAANRYRKKDCMNFIALDAHALPFASGSFDTVISLETIEHLDNPGLFVAGVTRVLKEGGKFICSTRVREEKQAVTHARFTVKEDRKRTRLH